jgi:hypothetical protein
MMWQVGPQKLRQKPEEGTGSARAEFDRFKGVIDKRNEQEATFNGALDRLKRYIHSSAKNPGEVARHLAIAMEAVEAFKLGKREFGDDETAKLLVMERLCQMLFEPAVRNHLGLENALRLASDLTSSESTALRLASSAEGLGADELEKLEAFSQGRH